MNANLDSRYPESLRLGGIALDTCSSTLRLDQDIFNLLSGFPLCDSGDTRQVVPPSSLVAFVPDGNANSIPISRILASTGVTSVSPSATSPELREFVMSEHFLSIVPPDNLQATVLLQVSPCLALCLKHSYLVLCLKHSYLALCLKHSYFVSQTLLLSSVSQTLLLSSVSQTLLLSSVSQTLLLSSVSQTLLLSSLSQTLLLCVSNTLT